MTNIKSLSKNYCPSVFTEDWYEEETFITSTLLGCQFVANKEVRDYNLYREKCSETCGSCCKRGYCGPWLPCEFIDLENTRVNLNTENFTALEKNEQVLHDLGWQKILEYIAKGYAYVNFYNDKDDKNKKYYYLDVPKTKNGGCALLTTEGCLLPFEQRPIRGAAISTKNDCYQLPFMRSSNCWYKDKYLNQILEIIYCMQISGELNSINETEIETKVKSIKLQKYH